MFRACTRTSTWTPRSWSGWPPPSGSTARRRGLLGGRRRDALRDPAPVRGDRASADRAVEEGGRRGERDRGDGGRARDPAGQHEAGRTLVAARHARGRLPGEHPYGAPPRAVPEDPGSRALGAAAVARDLRFADLARDPLAREPDHALDAGRGDPGLAVGGRCLEREEAL